MRYGDKDDETKGVLRREEEKRETLDEWEVLVRVHVGVGTLS